MATNNSVEEFELDDSMTEETKKFVISSLKIVRPSQVPKIDICLSRKARAANTAKIIQSLNFPNMKSRDIFVDNQVDGYKIAVSVYVPDELRPDPPITVFFHGGGWTFGSRDSHYFAAVNSAIHTKSIWLSVEYRLSPENKYPVPIDDCKSVVEYVINNKTEFGTLKSKIGVSGDSAGGHYAAIIAHELKQSIDYQLLIYPCVDLKTIYDSTNRFSKDCYILTPDMIYFFICNFLNDQSETDLPRISPLFNQDFSNLPKCLIIAAELDPLIDSGMAYFNKLKENSIDCDYKLIKGTIHGFFHNGIFLKDAFDETLKHMSQFFDKI